MHLNTIQKYFYINTFEIVVFIFLFIKMTISTEKFLNYAVQECPALLFRLHIYLHGLKSYENKNWQNSSFC